jgi:hypothetical protein
MFKDDLYSLSIQGSVLVYPSFSLYQTSVSVSAIQSEESLTETSTTIHVRFCNSVIQDKHIHQHMHHADENWI